MLEQRQQYVTYDHVSERHQAFFSGAIRNLDERGWNFELNYHVAFATWIEIRRARGMIMQSLSDEERYSKEYKFTNDTLSQNNRLTAEQIDELCNLTTLACVINGRLFWTKDLRDDDVILKVHTKILGKMREMTGVINNPDGYSRYGNAQVMHTFDDFMISYFEHGASQSDNLGDHFAMKDKPHVFLDGFSIAHLKKRIKQQPGAIIVLMPAASSGVLEAGIFADYMNRELEIPTTVDPVFFSIGMDDRGPINVTNSNLPKQNRIVIPLDDRVLGSGFSPFQAKKGAQKKYGKKDVLVSKKMIEHSAFWERRELYKTLRENLKSALVGLGNFFSG